MGLLSDFLRGFKKMFITGPLLFIALMLAFLAICWPIMGVLLTGTLVEEGYASDHVAAGIYIVGMVIWLTCAGRELKK